MNRILWRLLGYLADLADRYHIGELPDAECTCWPTPERMHFVYYGATEPGSAWEWNPDCEVHQR